MSFERSEVSRFRGRPIELFLFRYGSGPRAYYAYTNAEQVVSHEGIDYRPIPISRDAVRSNGTLDKSLLKIKMPKTAELPELFRVYPPSFVVTAVIRQGHYDENDTVPEALVVTSGRVINVTRSENEVEVGIEPNQTSMRRTGLRQHYQYGCPHELYGPRCRAEKKTFPARVAAIDNTVLTLVAGWNVSGQSAKLFRGGMIEWDGANNRDRRGILQVPDDGTLVVDGLPLGLQVGGTIDVVLGCPHDLRGCETVHSNVLNYGGDPWIPLESPFGKNPF